MRNDTAGHMEEDPDFPYIPPDLLTVLESRIPPYHPHPGVPPEKYWWEQGRRDVLEFLKRESASQRKR